MPFPRNKKLYSNDEIKSEKFKLSQNNMAQLREMRKSMGYSERELSLFLGDLISAVATGEIHYLPSNIKETLAVSKIKTDYKMLFCFCYEHDFKISIQRESKSVYAEPQTMFEAINIVQSCAVSVVHLKHTSTRYSQDLSIIINQSRNKNKIEYINCSKFKKDFEQFCEDSI